MKKLLALFTSICILVLCFAGCGAKYADSEYLGKWSATVAEMSGIEIGVDALFDNFDFELSETGKCTLNIDSEENTGKWDEGENGFVIEGELAFDKVEDGKVCINYDGVNIYFEKQ